MSSSPSRSLIFAMAAATGIAVANIYYAQPMLALIGAEFPGSFLPRLIPTVNQLGYAAGLFLILPLGDVVNRRKLIVGQFAVLAVALALAALSPSAGLLIVASLLLGMGSSVAHQIVPLSAALSAPDKRGQTIGIVMAGLLGGILFSQALAGFVATHAGWRQMYWLAVPLVASAAVAMALLLPKHHQPEVANYGAALRSLIDLWREEPALRRATLIQAGLFASFSAFWAVLALHLKDLHAGTDVAGMFGFLGIVSVIAAPYAGRLADRNGPYAGIRIGAGATLAAWPVFALWSGAGGLALGVALINAGVQTALVSNQHIVYAQRYGARGRLNTIFMTGTFLGGAFGSSAGAAVWAMGGWTPLLVLGVALAGSAPLFAFKPRKTAAAH